MVRLGRDDARIAALAEVRRRLTEAETLVLAGEPGRAEALDEALEKAGEALARSSSYPPPPPDANGADPSEENLRAGLNAFLNSLR